MKEKKLGDLPQRILSHSVGTLILAAVIFLANYCYFRPFFTLFTAVVAMMALSEYYGMVKKKQITPAVSLGLLFTFLYIFASFLKLYHDFPVPEIVLGLALLSFFIYFAFPRKEPLSNISASFFGLIYIAVPFGLLLRIIYLMPFGTFWLIFLIVVTKGGDMGGYFLGRYFGKHKLAKNLSPNKTIEGAVGSLLASALLALLLVYIRKNYISWPFDFSYITAAILGIVLAIFGILGDLAESLLKRDAKMKDSSTFIPGIGGVLDVVDALLFTTPALFIYLKLHYNI